MSLNSIISYFRKSWLVIRFVLFMFCIHAHPVSALQVQDGKGNNVLRAAGINIEVIDVIDSTEFLFKYRFARLANYLHIKTKESIIMRELLFFPDSVLTVRRLKESANNLRRLGIFQWVTITVDTLENSYGIAQVKVKDLFSSEIKTSVRIEGGNLKLGVGFNESNLAGRGYKVRVSAVKQDTRDFIKLVFTNPRFLGSRFINDLRYVRFSDAESYSIGFNKIYYSQETKWDAGINLFDFSGNDLIYESSSGFKKFNRSLKQYQTYFGYYFGENMRFRTGLQYFHKDNFWTDPVPANGKVEWRSRRLSVNFGGIKRNISTGRNIDRSEFEEDIHTGLLFKTGFGLDFPSLGSDYRRESFSTHLFFGRRFSSDEYAFLEAGHGRTQQKGKTIERVTNGRLTFFSTRLRNQTLAGSVSYSRINFRQPFTQLFLGENTGLRGYLNREFIGDRRILINLENRVFSNYRLMSARFGGVLFFDSGKIWNTGEGFDSGKWRTSMGIGLRLGIPKFSQGIIRIDVAYNFDRRKFSTFSFSNGSYFRVLFPMQIGIQNFDFTISN